MSGFEMIVGCSDADDVHEGCGGFFVSCCDCSALFETCPQVFDQMSVPMRQGAPWQMGVHGPDLASG